MFKSMADATTIVHAAAPLPTHFQTLHHHCAALCDEHYCNARPPPTLSARPLPLFFLRARRPTTFHATLFG